MVTDLKISSEYRDSVSKYSDEQLDATEMVVEIPWEPSAVAKIEAHPGVKFVVFVPNVRSMVVAAERLSQNLKFDIPTLETGRLSLSGKSETRWQDFVKSLGPVAAKSLVLKLATRAIARGNPIGGFVEIVDGVLFDGIRVSDADILGRAQDLRRRK
jgi:hypothetical protein